MGEVDHLVLIAPLTNATRGLLNSEVLHRMKPSAHVVNVGRGALVDEPALVKVLQEKKIAGAGLDVFDQEPLPLDHPLRKLTHVTFSPHTGYVSDSMYEVRVV